MNDDDDKRLSDKWLCEVMTPNRHYRDYYIDGHFGRLTIRLSQGHRPTAIFDRTTITEVRTRGDVRRLVSALGMTLR